jgi:hypothetical protein
VLALRQEPEVLWWLQFEKLKVHWAVAPMTKNIYMKSIYDVKYLNYTRVYLPNILNSEIHYKSTFTPDKKSPPPNKIKKIVSYPRI